MNNFSVRLSVRHVGVQTCVSPSSLSFYLVLHGFVQPIIAHSSCLERWLRWMCWTRRFQLLGLFLDHSTANDMDVHVNVTFKAKLNKKISQLPLRFGIGNWVKQSKSMLIYLSTRSFDLAGTEVIIGCTVMTIVDTL